MRDVMPEIDGETAEDEDRNLRRHVLAHGARGVPAFDRCHRKRIESDDDIALAHDEGARSAALVPGRMAPQPVVERGLAAITTKAAEDDPVRPLSRSHATGGSCSLRRFTELSR